MSLPLEMLLGFAAAFMGQWIATHVALWPARRQAPGQHWSERALRSWSARQLVVSGPAVLFGTMLVLAGMDAHGVSRALRVGLLPLGAAIGAMWGGLPVARRVFRRRVRLRDLLSDYTVSFLVLSPSLSVFILMLLLLLPRGLDAASLGIMAGAFALALALTLGLALPLVRAIGLLAPAPLRLKQIVEEASRRAGVEPAPVHVLRWHQANAIAFPYARLLAFTPPVLNALNDEELLAVTAHEIAHLQESRRAKLTRLSGLLVSFPAFTIPVWAKAFGLPGVIAPAAVMLIGGRLLRAFNQRMEARADAAAHATKTDERDPALATALEKIYEFNLVPAVMRGKRQTHPHLYDRLVAAGLQPAYPRPGAPSIVLNLVALVLLLASVLGPLAFAREWARSHDGKPSHRSRI